MAKIHTITDINMRANWEVIFIPAGSFIEVTEAMAVYFCNEDVEALPAAEQSRNRRTKKAVRTGFFSMDNLTKPHEDYTFL